MQYYGVIIILYVYCILTVINSDKECNNLEIGRIT